MTLPQRSLTDFDPKKKGRTYGDYIQTKEAKARSDSAIRKSINNLLKKQGHKLIKYKIGKPGSLDYGRVVVMTTRELFQDDPEMLAMYKRNHPRTGPTIWVHFWDYSRYTSDKPFESMSFKNKKKAEEAYNRYCRFLGYGDT